MNVITRSLQKELNHYYKLIQSGDFDIQQVSKSAFTQACAKLKHTAFVELSHKVVEKFYYPSVSLFVMLQNMQVDFIARLNENWWTVARKLIEGSRSEAIVRLKVNPNHYQQLVDRGVEARIIRCRIIRHTLPNGEKMVLCTTLLDRWRYSRKNMVAAYHKRWGIEESYNFLKWESQPLNIVSDQQNFRPINLQRPARLHVLEKEAQASHCRISFSHQQISFPNSPEKKVPATIINQTEIKNEL